MGHGGKRLNAGRPKGTPNKATARRERDIALSGASPFDVMIRVMRYNEDMAEQELKKEKPNRAKVKASFARALEAAHKAAAYVHSKRASLEQNPQLFDPELLHNIPDDDLDELTRIIDKAIAVQQNAVTPEA